MRKILWALVVAVFLSSAPVPVRAATPVQASCRRQKKVKKAKWAKHPKYKARKFNRKKFKKASNLHQSPSR